MNRFRFLLLTLFSLLLCFRGPAESAPDPRSRPRLALHAVLEMVEGRAVQFGNYQDAIRCLRFHRKVLAGGPPLPDFQAHLNRLEAISLIATGRTFEAERLCAGWQEQDPIRQGLLRALALALGARQNELSQQLADLDEGSQKVKLSPLLQFMLTSLHLHLDWLEFNTLDSARLAQRYRAALAQLKPYSSARRATTGEGWYLEQAMKLWDEPLLTRIHSENQDPKAQMAMLDAYYAGQSLLHDLAKANLTPENFNPEFSFGVLDNLLTTYEDFTAHLWLDKTVTQRSDLAQLFAELEPTIQTTSSNFRESIQQLNKMVLPLVEGAIFEGEAYRPDLLTFTLRSGSTAQLLARFYRIQLRGIWNLVDGRLDRALASQARSLLDKAAEEQRRPDLSGLYLGTKDIRFDEVEWLLRQQEGDWKNRCQQLLPQLMEEARLQHYPPARAQALALQGRLELAQNHLKEAETRVQEAIDLSEAGVLGFDLSPRALLERRQRHSRLYRLLSEIKLRRGDSEGALACLELQTRTQTLDNQPPSAEQTRQLKMREALAAEQRSSNGRVAGLSETLAQLDKVDLASLTARSVRPKLTSLSLIRQQLPPDVSVVSYLPLEKELRLFVVRPNGLVMRSAPVARADLYEAVRRFRRLAVGTALASPRQAIQPGLWSSPYGLELSAQSRQLYDWLIGPIQQDIASDTTLAVVATGPLNYLPFAALIGPGSPDQSPNFLCRSKACVNLVGVSDILRLTASQAISGDRLVALGDPDGSLPDSVTEVNAIAKMFPNPRIYLGPRANRQSLEWEGLSPSFLHIATHGTLDGSHPDASFLVLAGQGEEHKLRVPEIYSLHLKETELVVLSACQSALGEVEPGSEITSLADAFAVAGSRSVLASLWSVSDASTSQLMQAFYRHRQQAGLGRALQLAQLELIGQPATAHPFFWAPFILLGDFR